VKRTVAIGSKAEHNRNTMATDAIAPNLAKKTGDFLAASADRAHTNGGSRKNKYSKLKSRVYTVQLIYYGCR